MFRFSFICSVPLKHVTDLCQSQGLTLLASLWDWVPHSNSSFPKQKTVALQSSVGTLALQEEMWGSGSGARKGSQDYGAWLQLSCNNTYPLVAYIFHHFSKNKTLIFLGRVSSVIIFLSPPRSYFTITC